MKKKLLYKKEISMILNTGLRTDIPGFFSEWFYNRIDEGFVNARSP